jgi:hypothetical protein
MTTFFKEDVLVLPEVLKNKYVFNKISPSYILISENLLVLPKFLKNKYFVKGKSPKNIRIPEK